jgi:hypothetical protein
VTLPPLPKHVTPALIDQGVVDRDIEYWHFSSLAAAGNPGTSWLVLTRGQIVLLSGTALGEIHETFGIPRNQVTEIRISKCILENIHVEIRRIKQETADIDFQIYAPGDPTWKTLVAKLSEAFSGKVRNDLIPEGQSTTFDGPHLLGDFGAVDFFAAGMQFAALPEFRFDNITVSSDLAAGGVAGLTFPTPESTPAAEFSLPELNPDGPQPSPGPTDSKDRAKPAPRNTPPNRPSRPRMPALAPAAPPARAKTAPASISCPSCNRSNKPGNAFCLGCGAALQGQTDSRPAQQTSARPPRQRLTPRSTIKSGFKLDDSPSSSGLEELSGWLTHLFYIIGAIIVLMALDSFFGK